jgi:hypothetical protein
MDCATENVRGALGGRWHAGVGPTGKDLRKRAHGYLRRSKIDNKAALVGLGHALALCTSMSLRNKLSVA